MATDVAPARSPGPPASSAWWERYRGRISPGYLELIEAESSASRIVHFHPIFVPGLLQTEDYARAITPATTLGGMPADEVEAYVRVRMQRQREVLDGSKPISLVFLLDETALRRQVGEAGTMRGQFNHLRQMLDRQDMTIAVVPRATPAHPGLLGAFMLCQYSDPRIRDVVCFDGPTGNTVIRDQPDLAREYGLLADWLTSTSLRNDLAMRSIQSALDDLPGR